MTNNNRFYAPGLMDLTDYQVKQVAEDEWNEFVSLSKQGTLFNQTNFINSLIDGPVLLGCYKGDDLKGAICLFESASNGQICRPELAIYNSIMLKDADSNQAAGNQFAEQFRTISAMTRSLAHNYNEVHFQTHYSLIDLRPLLWHEYGTDQPKFACQPRYTTVVCLADSIQLQGDILSSPLYKRCSKSRRQEIRYAYKKGISCEKEYDWPIFENLYKQTFKRQGIELDQHQLDEIKSVCDALYKDNQLLMYTAANQNNEIGSIAIFGYDSKRAYYLYGSNSPVAREDHTGSYVLFAAFEDMMNCGITEVDLEGVNSPARGHFKMSFGGDLKTYYSLSLSKG